MTDQFEVTNVAKQLNKIRNGRKVVFLLGVFDILHHGHIKYLNDAKKLGDILVVGLINDADTKDLKGIERPLISEWERAFTLSNVKAVDYVVILPKRLIKNDVDFETYKALKPDIFVVPLGGSIYDTARLVVSKYGGKVVQVDTSKVTSTTEIFRRIKNLTTVEKVSVDV